MIGLNLENDQPSGFPKTETMANLQQVRNYRLQKSSLESSTVSFGNKENYLSAMESEENSISQHVPHAVKRNDIREDLQCSNRYHLKNEPQDCDQISKENEESSITQLERVEEHQSLSENPSEDKTKLVLQDIDTQILANKSRELHARFVLNLLLLFRHEYFRLHSGCSQIL